MELRNVSDWKCLRFQLASVGFNKKQLEIIKQIHDIIIDKKENAISIIWEIGDIKYRAKINGIELNDNECREILSDLYLGHDAEQGINWDVIDNYINRFIEERE